MTESAGAENAHAAAMIRPDEQESRLDIDCAFQVAHYEYVGRQALAAVTEEFDQGARIEQLQEEQSQLLFEVSRLRYSDERPGISKEYQDHLFALRALRGYGAFTLEELLAFRVQERAKEAEVDHGQGVTGVSRIVSMMDRDTFLLVATGAVNNAALYHQEADVAAQAPDHKP